MGLILHHGVLEGTDKPPSNSIASEDGSALISVLSVILWLSLFTAIYWSFLKIQLQFINRDAQRLQAEYVAEAGIHIAISHLEANPLWETQDTLYTLADSLVGRMKVLTHGAFHIVRAKAQAKDDNISLQAMIAARPNGPFDHALYLWDQSARLNVAGTTSIYGPISTGRLGIRQNRLPGIRYTGDLIGTINYIDNLTPPHFSDTLITRNLQRYDELIDFYSPGSHTEKAPAASLFMPDELTVYFSLDDVFISDADSLEQPVKVITPGNITLAGQWHLPEGSTLLAGGRIDASGNGSGTNLVFYGRNGISVSEQVQCSVQLFSRSTLYVSDLVHLQYPSLLYSKASQEVIINIDGKAQVDGFITQSNAMFDRSSSPLNRIVVADSALMRGALFNPFQTELKGDVHGSVVTHQFHLYHSPRRYVNWILDSEINYHLRPLDFHVPPGFPGQLEPINWKRSADSKSDSSLVTANG